MFESDPHVGYQESTCFYVIVNGDMVYGHLLCKVKIIYIKVLNTL
jgi:hypothetical protein